MGWDIERFPEGEVNLELICCICTCILEDPVESPCRHVFCSTCIKTWLSNQKSCPHCRAPVHKKDLQPVVPLLKNIISKQKIYCDNKDGGCPEIITLEGLSSHVALCQFAMVSCLNDGCIIKVCRKDLKSHMELCSKRTILCEHGCEMFLTLGDRTTHNCVHALRCHFQEVANEMQDRISKLEELVNVMVSKNHGGQNEVVPSVDNNDASDTAVYVPYSIPSPRAYDNSSQAYTVFPRLSNTANLSSIAESNDFSDSVESVESENIDQDNDMEGREFHSRTRQQNISQEREVSPVYRQLNGSQSSVRVNESFESRGRNERVRESERVAIRSRSAHNRTRFEPYTRSSRQSNSRSRETRIERTNRTYQYYQRESRRVNPSVSGGGISGGGGSGVSGGGAAAAGGGGAGGGEMEEPLILRIGVSSQTVTDSSTSSASSSDSENEE